MVVAPGSCGPINGTSTTTMPTLNSYFCTVGTKSSNAWGGNWSSLTSTTSSAGFYVTSAEYGGYIYTSDDGGVTWTKRAASGYKNWIAVTSGQNGTSPANAAHRIYGAVGGGALYKSADRGVNWTVDSSAIISGSNIWSSIIYSPNSIRAVAAVDGGYIYRMTSGNWGSSYSVNKNWKALAGSTDLTYLAAAPSGDYIYTSTNFGAAWASKTGSGSRMWSAVASSADGTKLAAAESNGYIYTASDSTRAFATWTKRTPAGASVPKAWKAITSSSDGAKLAAVANAGYIYTSTNSGGAWTARTGPGVQAWSAITSSSDGTKLVAATTGGDIYTSSDSGATWIRRWVSGSGTKYYWLCAGTGGGASSPECSLTMTMACGSANGVETASAPSSNLCNTIGSSTAPVHDTPNMKYDWMCSFPNGTVPVSCSAPEIREGECGLAAGKTYSSAPTTDLCTSTTNNPAPVAVQSGSNYVWTCTGNPAGHDASCSALVEDYKLKISNKLVVTPPVVNPGCSNNNDGCICTVSWPEGEVFEDGYNNGLTECSLSSQGHVVTGMDKFHPKNDHQNYATSTLFKDTLFTLSCWGKKNQGNVQTASGICRVNFSAKESN